MVVNGAYVRTSGGLWISGRHADTIAPAAFVLGTTKPDATNTGPRVSVASMTVINGDYTVSTAGITVQGLDVRGNIIVNAPNVTVQDCKVRGRVGTFRVYPGQPFLVQLNSPGAVVQFCDIGFDTSFGGFPHFAQNGIGGTNFTAYRNNVHDATDLIDFQGGHYDCNAHGNYLHDLSFRNDDHDHFDDSVHPWWSHSDGMQFKGGRDADVFGNNFMMYMSSTTSWVDGPDQAVYPGTTSAPPTGGRTGGSPWGSGMTNGTTTEVRGLIHHNWGWGGDLFFQCNVGVAATQGSIYGNRVSKDQYASGSNYQIRYSNTGLMINPNTPENPGSGLDMNIWDPDGPGVITGNKGQPLTSSTQTGSSQGGIRIP